MTHTSAAPLELMGMPGSPYTRKMLALMRYRNIPYRLEFQRRLAPGSPAENAARPRFKTRPGAKVPLLPTFYFTDDRGEMQAVTDSTPLLRRFEQEYPQKSVLPAEPAMRFLDALIEDYADEWLTKAMFHYRWAYQQDIDKASAVLPRWNNIAASDQDIAPMSKFIGERQIARLSYVGSNDITRQTIEQSFERFIRLLDAHLTQYPFVMGHRPGACDFAIFGQLTCLAQFDPTPAGIVLKTSPRVYAWVDMLDDMSGYQCYDEDWLSARSAPPTLQAILGEIGGIYAPYLLANARAVRSGDQQMRTVLDGRPWQQNPFPYQVKCLNWLREHYLALPAAEQTAVQQALAGTGAEALLSDGDS